MRGGAHLLLLLVAGVIAAGCGPAKYRLATPSASTGSEDRPCVVRSSDGEWQPGQLTQHLCGAWTDLNEFDIISDHWIFFPHLLLGSAMRFGRDCPECWVEIRRGDVPPDETQPHWRVRLHAPPHDTVVATWEGGFADGAFQGPGTLTLLRTEACTGYCRDYFVADGRPLQRLTLEGRWESGFLEDSEAFTARFTAEDGTTYEGDARYDMVRGVLPHGQGLRRAPDGDTYHGQWQDGRPHGHGEHTYADGATYLGGHVDGRWEGEGELVTADGVRYVGGFVAGQRHGFGEQTEPDGLVHRGEWRADQPHGDGIRVHASGISYEGAWERGKLLPKHVRVVWADGLTYEGPLVERQPHGFGRATWTTGEDYIGTWEGGRMAGLGALTWPDGALYAGAWAEGRPSGCGLHRSASGDDWVGTWRSGVPLEADCPERPRSWTPEEIERLGIEGLTTTSLAQVWAKQRATKSAREDAAEQLPRVARRYGSLLPTEVTEEEPRVVQLAFAWSGEGVQRLVHPSCVEGDALEVRVGDAVTPVRIGGVVDADATLRMAPGATTKVCAFVQGPCGQGSGCAPVDVPMALDAPTPRVRILLEPPVAPPASEDLPASP